MEVQKLSSLLTWLHLLALASSPTTGREGEQVGAPLSREKGQVSREGE